MLFRISFAQNNPTSIISFCEENLSWLPSKLNKFIFNLLSERKLISGIDQNNFIVDAPVSFSHNKEITCYYYGERRRRNYFCTIVSITPKKASYCFSEWSGDINGLKSSWINAYGGSINGFISSGSASTTGNIQIETAPGQVGQTIVINNNSYQWQPAQANTATIQYNRPATNQYYILQNEYQELIEVDPNEVDNNELVANNRAVAIYND